MTIIVNHGTYDWMMGSYPHSNMCKIQAVRRLWTAVLFLCFSYGAMVWVYLGNR